MMRATVRRARRDRRKRAAPPSRRCQSHQDRAGRYGRAGSVGHRRTQAWGCRRRRERRRKSTAAQSDGACCWCAFATPIGRGALMDRDICHFLVTVNLRCHLFMTLEKDDFPPRYDAVNGVNLVHWNCERQFWVLLTQLDVGRCFPYKLLE